MSIGIGNKTNLNILVVVLTATVSHQVRIVTRSWIGNRAGASGEQVAHVVRQYLHFIGRHFGVIPQNVIVGRPTCPLNQLNIYL